MDNITNATRVRQCFTAWETGDRALLESLLAPGFTFTSPHDDHISRADYWATCWPNHGEIDSYRFLNLVEDGDAVLVRYTCTLTGGASFTNVEHFTFQDGQIASVEVYFGRGDS